MTRQTGRKEIVSYTSSFRGESSDPNQCACSPRKNDIS